MDGRTLTLAPSGWTYDNVFVLYDKETQTLWYPGDDGLIGVQGEYFKRKLPEIPSRETRWRQWKKAFPHSTLLQ